MVSSAPRPGPVSSMRLPNWPAISVDAPSMPVSGAAGGRTPSIEQLWDTLVASGLDRLTSDADNEAGPAELAVVLYWLARSSAAVPVAETDLLAAWLMQRADIDVPTGEAVDRRPGRGDGAGRVGHRRGGCGPVGAFGRPCGAGRGARAWRRRCGPSTSRWPIPPTRWSPMA